MGERGKKKERFEGRRKEKETQGKTVLEGGDKLDLFIVVQYVYQFNQNRLNYRIQSSVIFMSCFVVVVSVFSSLVVWDIDCALRRKLTGESCSAKKILVS